jgi:transposase
MKECIRLSAQEQRRLMVLAKLDRGEVTVAEAARVLSVSVRQVWRLRAAYRERGAAGLAHGNRGRTPVHAVPGAVREQVVTLARSPAYQGCNDQHFTELLAEREGLVLSRPTVRRILRQAGVTSPRRRRAPKHRTRRERMPQAGMLLQLDGSSHDWLEGRGPRLCVVAAIDDATGEPVAARFRLQEDAHGYLLVLRDILATMGIPLAVYRDRHGIFERRQREPWTLEEELAGERFPTQVGRALAELAIEAIPSHSPQSRGRIERLWGTWQDRLVKVLRLAGASTLEEADRVLQDYLPDFSRRFAVPATLPDSAYRPLPPGLDPDTVCCFKYRRTVANDNTVTLGEHRLQLQPTTTRRSHVKATVEVHERLDGSLAVYHQRRPLAVTDAPATAPQLRARKAQRVAPMVVVSSPETTASQAVATSLPPPPPAAPDTPPRKPAATHPWRKGYGPKPPRVTESLTS